MLGILVVILAVAYLAWIGRRSTRRNADGLCIRCGRNSPIPAGEIVDPAFAGMCAACVGMTERNHRAAFWFCVALAPIMLVVITLGMISDSRSGSPFDWRFIPAIVVAPGLPLAMAAFIRASSRRRS